MMDFQTSDLSNEQQLTESISNEPSKHLLAQSQQ